jgi:hypothetical protein
MGLFDWFKKDNNASGLSIIAPKETKPVSKRDFSKPRLYHYHFAHRYLPDLLKQNPQGVERWITEEKGDDHLQTRWGLQMTPYRFDPTPHTAVEGGYFEPVGLGREVIPLTDSSTMVVIRFPQPERPPEAFFAAIIFNIDGSHSYYTLELTIGKAQDGYPPTVLGSWACGAHFNHGRGPRPEMNDFVDDLLERLGLEKARTLQADKGFIGSATAIISEEGNFDGEREDFYPRHPQDTRRDQIARNDEDALLDGLDDLYGKRE